MQTSKLLGPVFWENAILIFQLDFQQLLLLLTDYQQIFNYSFVTLLYTFLLFFYYFSTWAFFVRPSPSRSPGCDLHSPRRSSSDGTRSLWFGRILGAFEKIADPLVPTVPRTGVKLYRVLVSFCSGASSGVPSFWNLNPVKLYAFECCAQCCGVRGRILPI